MRKAVGEENQKQEISAPAGEPASAPRVSLSRFKPEMDGEQMSEATDEPFRRPDPQDILATVTARKKKQNKKHHKTISKQQQQGKKHKKKWILTSLAAVRSSLILFVLFGFFFFSFFALHFVPVLLGSVLLPPVFTSDNQTLLLKS